MFTKPARIFFRVAGTLVIVGIIVSLLAACNLQIKDQAAATPTPIPTPEPGTADVPDVPQTMADIAQYIVEADEFTGYTFYEVGRGTVGFNTTLGEEVSGTYLRPYLSYSPEGVIGMRMAIEIYGTGPLPADVSPASPVLAFTTYVLIDTVRHSFGIMSDDVELVDGGSYFADIRLGDPPNVDETVFLSMLAMQWDVPVRIQTRGDRVTTVENTEAARLHEVFKRLFEIQAVLQKNTQTLNEEPDQ